MQGDRRHHDMGGLDAGPVEQAGHDHAAWEKRIDAIRGLLTKRGLITVDEMRRGIEDLGHGAYDELSYYERWLSSEIGRAHVCTAVTKAHPGCRLQIEKKNK